MVLMLSCFRILTEPYGSILHIKYFKRVDGKMLYTRKEEGLGGSSSFRVCIYLTLVKLLLHKVTYNEKENFLLSEISFK